MIHPQTMESGSSGCREKTFWLDTSVTCSNLQAKPCVAPRNPGFHQNGHCTDTPELSHRCYDVLLSSSCVAKDCCLDAKMCISLKLPKGYWFSNSKDPRCRIAAKKCMYESCLNKHQVLVQTSSS